MKRPFYSLAILAVLSAANVSFAAAQGGQPPKPGPEHERLGYFVGQWVGEGEYKAGPMGPGGKTTGRDSCEWFDGRYSLICHSEGTSPMGSEKSYYFLGYNTDEKVYTYYGVNNSGMDMTTVPKGTVKGDTWTYFDESMMGGKKVKSRVIIKELSPTSYTFKMDMQGPDGKWIPLVETRNTKQQ